MRRSLRWTEGARRAVVVATALLCLDGVGSARAHEGEEHPAPRSGDATGAFATPAPGTYALPPLGVAADATVLTSAGRSAQLHALFGHEVVLLSFIYTRCSDAEGCPLATAVLHNLGSRLAAEPELLPRVRLLSLSFDPERDTPEVMRRYAESFLHQGIDWQFLTTSGEAELAPLLSAYRQTRVPERDEQDRETGQFAHLLRVYLIDRERRIRQVYSTSLLEPEALVADVKTLLLEASRSDAPRARVAEGSVNAALAAHVSGDVRSGYESVDFTTRSSPLEARRGRALDLAGRVREPPRGLPRVPVPSDNRITREKVSLGRRLFFDRRLSQNDTVSCAMCHVPEQGFANNEMATAVGIQGRSVRRNAPTIFNAAYLQHLFHDGRETSLEQQVWGPLLARNEMGNPSIGALIEKLRRIDDYTSAFEKAFPGRGLAIETVGMALASYERTLISGSSAFDRYLYAGEAEALSSQALDGLALFSGRAGCVGCHPIGSNQSLFTDDDFHNTGVGYEAAMGTEGRGTDGVPSSVQTQRVQAAPGVYLEVPRAIVEAVSEPRANDLGVYEITLDPADRWRYRTPTLRNVALTAPYMHDGSIPTLAGVVEFYRRGGFGNQGLDALIRPLQLDDDEVAALVAFLESLTGDDVGALVADAFAAPIGDASSPDSTASRSAGAP
ncbi:MAG: SCO family protein [Deltaproteobacteria bacterium]|nr:SCO family protein [Deltaproteobacteria bacterium]MBW2384106.1 SCO family protein [Deltaproteobacteria bacterium]